MVRAVFFAFLVVAMLNAELVMSSNQHLICKTVEDNVSDHLSRLVNYAAIEMSIQTRVTTEIEAQETANDVINATIYSQQHVIKRLNENVEFLKEEVAKLNSTISSLQTSVQNLQSENEKMREGIQSTKKKCECGEFYYDGYCFWLDVTNRNFSQSESKCRSRNSDVGIILDSSHYDIVMNKLREATKLRGDVWGWIWLGLEKNPSTGAVTIILNGLKAPFLKWRKTEPSRSSSETNIVLAAYKGPSVGAGMADAIPSWTYGVLCQY